MNASHPNPFAASEDAFGRQVAAQLSIGTQELPRDIGERLRAARVQAMARRKLAPRTPTLLVESGHTAVLGGGWWTRVASIVPLVALLAGLVAISVVQDERRADELAEVDSALLTDELPPAAFTDPGFAQFLRSEASAQR
ncbi:conserved hypothetical protein [Burkholderiales bacterium 8X]|nr:conserved hypothetical protein [Burkholderiales bacterium 8X]